MAKAGIGGWQVLKSESCASPQEWIAKPDGFQIPESASQIHGISTEKANKVGTPLKKILTNFIILFARRKRIQSYWRHTIMSLILGSWRRSARARSIHWALY